MSLAADARALATSTVQKRLAALEERLEEAASEGCFSLEVPLDASFGPPQWWWQADSQDLVGDHLTSLGLQCVFRNPRGAVHTPYPSLHVSWFNAAHIASVVGAKHVAAREGLIGAKGPFLCGPTLLLSDCVGLKPVEAGSDVGSGLLRLIDKEDSATEERSFCLSFDSAVSRGSDPSLRVVITSWRRPFERVTMNNRDVTEHVNWRLSFLDHELTLIWNSAFVRELCGKVKVALH